jgi:hypothetical protein
MLISTLENYHAADLVATRQSDDEESRGIVFAHPERLVTLRMRGCLSIMDSTHGTNWLGWQLYTIMVRDEYSCWIPSAHFLTEKEDADILVECLRQLKRWCGGRSGWRLRYMLTDDSAAEQSAVKRAFPGLIDGEVEVDHLLCMVHSERTLKRNFAGPKYKKSLHHMIAALKYRRTKGGCMDSLQQALDALPEGDIEKERYINKEWVQTASQWANYAREHSTLLMQVKTTNSVESWHSVIKSKAGKSQMQQFSLAGIAGHVLACAKEYDLRSEKAAADFRTKRHPMVIEHPWLSSFPYPVQLLIIQQMKQGEENLEDGEDSRDLLDEVTCDCGFYRRYQLLCRHIWANHVLFKCLDSSHFLLWAHMWEDSGFEIYETIGKEYFEREIDEDIGVPTRRRLDMREALDNIKERYYQIEEAVQNWKPEEADRFMKWWIEKLHRATGEMWKHGIVEFERETGVRVEQQNTLRVELGGRFHSQCIISSACR